MEEDQSQTVICGIILPDGQSLVAQGLFFLLTSTYAHLWLSATVDEEKAILVEDDSLNGGL